MKKLVNTLFFLTIPFWFIPFVFFDVAKKGKHSYFYKMWFDRDKYFWE